MDLKWNHKASVVYKTCALTLLTGCEDWPFSPTRQTGNIKTFEKLTALFVAMPIHYLIYGKVKFDTNILKMHMCANIKKISFYRLGFFLLPPDLFPLFISSFTICSWALIATALSTSPIRRELVLLFVTSVLAGPISSG